MMWAGLGVGPQALAARPTADTYPSVFTPNCKHLWAQVVASLDSGTAQELWTEAIREFVIACRSANTSPFLGTQQSRNDRIVTALRTSRRAVLKVLDNAQAFNMLTLKAVARSCRVTDKGLVLRVMGSIQAVDPSVTNWLLKKPWPAFRLKTRGVYRKTLDANTEMVFFNEGANLPLRWHIGYEITLPTLPALPDPQASARDMETFVLKVLWHHVMLDTRTRVWHRRKI